MQSKKVILSTCLLCGALLSATAVQAVEAAPAPTVEAVNKEASASLDSSRIIPLAYGEDTSEVEKSVKIKATYDKATNKVNFEVVFNPDRERWFTSRVYIFLPANMTSMSKINVSTQTGWTKDYEPEQFFKEEGTEGVLYGILKVVDRGQVTYKDTLKALNFKTYYEEINGIGNYRDTYKFSLAMKDGFQMDDLYFLAALANSQYSYVRVKAVIPTPDAIPKHKKPSAPKEEEPKKDQPEKPQKDQEVTPPKTPESPKDTPQENPPAPKDEPKAETPAPDDSSKGKDDSTPLDPEGPKDNGESTPKQEIPEEKPEQNDSPEDKGEEAPAPQEPDSMEPKEEDTPPQPPQTDENPESPEEPKEEQPSPENIPDSPEMEKPEQPNPEEEQPKQPTPPQNDQPKEEENTAPMIPEEPKEDGGEPEPAPAPKEPESMEPKEEDTPPQPPQTDEAPESKDNGESTPKQEIPEDKPEQNDSQAPKDDPKTENPAPQEPDNTQPKEKEIPQQPKVDVKTEVKVVDVDFPKQRKEDPQLEKGQTRVERGEKGTERITYQVEYTNGKETKRTVTKRERLKEPKTEITYVGTKPVERVEHIVEAEVLPFKTIRRANPELFEGLENVVTKGQNGTAFVTYKITKVDGAPTKKEKVSTKVQTPAVDQVVEYGTKKRPVIVKSEVKETQVILHSTKKIENANLEKGKTRTLVAGQNGEKVITYAVVTVDGVETKREKINELITKPAVDTVIEIGTKETTQISAPMPKTPEKDSGTKAKPDMKPEKAPADTDLGNKIPDQSAKTPSASSDKLTGSNTQPVAEQKERKELPQTNEATSLLSLLGSFLLTGSLLTIKSKRRRD
ncbi:G5 domain-containing protein [Streptococcus merionis]|uniref:G5 domain-containing protein n=1 Tax=Streptococcus merionis TaxID=400065 RepID=UPI00351674AF